MKTIHLAMIFIMLSSWGCTTHYYSFKEGTVTISLVDKKAKTVLFSCTLDGYTSRPLHERNSVWEITLKADKEFRYFYTVDDQLYLPPCPLRESDDFGSENCIFEPESILENERL